MFSILGHTSILLAFENPEASLYDPMLLFNRDRLTVEDHVFVSAYVK